MLMTNLGFYPFSIKSHSSINLMGSDKYSICHCRLVPLHEFLQYKVRACANLWALPIAHCLLVITLF